LLSKFDCSNAPDPESPSHVLSSPETNSEALINCFAAGSLKQSAKPGSFGMHVRDTSSLIRLTPALAPASSVGLESPYPMTLTSVEYNWWSVIGGSMTGVTY
jgi:hypothetical protein